ncbi:MAG: aldehyde dehydrogenase [Solirubrobacterales bacterium]|nr:aldehyde dehydrogenase [Solirubrobacterales bacterium]
MSEERTLTQAEDLSTPARSPVAQIAHWPRDAFIDGRFVDAVSGARFECVSPVSGEILCHVAECGAEDVDRAVRAARRAFEGGAWRNAEPQDRKTILFALAELIEADVDVLGTLITMDMGKPITDAREEVLDAAGTLRYYAEAIDKVYGEVGPTGPSALTLMTREPLGVVGIVVPWNYPLDVPMWKLAPALATGNSVVVKPAEQSPLCILRLAELALQVELPQGVLNVVPGFGEVAGKALGLHMEVDKIAFTGSTEVGKLFLTYAGASNMKGVQLECGGKSPSVILSDVPDLELAVEETATGIFVNSGQMCNASSRLLVHESIRDQVLERLAQQAEQWQPGDPLHPDTRLGAMVDERQMERVLDYIRLGSQEGAELYNGGHRAREETGGFYVEPTVFTGVDAGMRIAREEIFGPVLAVQSFSSEEEALRAANDTAYGLSAAVWTSDVNKAHRFARGLSSGTVYVNCYDYGDLSLPFGGYKQSGGGRDLSVHALENYTQVKMTYIRLLD